MIIKRIKNYIIHKLGGYTEEENISDVVKDFTKNYFFKLGVAYIAHFFYSECERLYGTDSNKWIDTIYSDIKRLHDTTCKNPVIIKDAAKYAKKFSLNNQNYGS